MDRDGRADCHSRAGKAMAPKDWATCAAFKPGSEAGVREDPVAGSVGAI